MTINPMLGSFLLENIKNGDTIEIGIEKVEFEKNNFIYMCADPNRFGLHRYTENDTEHAKNAKAYQDWLNAKNIK